MYYLFIDNKNDEEREFKLLLYDRFERSERLKMSELHDIKKEKNGYGIDEIEKKIFKSDYYKNLNPNLKEYYQDRRKWTNLNISDRAKRTNIECNRVKFMYQFLSQYAHSSSFAMMQFGAADEKGVTEKQLSSVACNYAAALLALTIELSSQFFNTILNTINQDKEFETQLGVLFVYFTKPMET
jgi:hypothetical protein